MPSENKLYIVGLGPGSRDQMSIQALRSIKESDFVVGHRPYLEMISDLLQGKQVVSSSMGKEVDRARKAADLMSEGTVALVSSGDPNIYGMAGLGLELAGDLSKVEVIPGVTSFAAAACRSGLTFKEAVAVVSLSDLLTPWQDIESRLKTAAEMDLPTALYNPRSRRRNWQLDRALEMRPAETSVLVARSVSRPGEKLFWTTAGELLGSEPLRDEIDMFTLVIIGGRGARLGRASVESMISIVGIGPGSTDQLTIEGQRLLKKSSKIFGAGRYLREIEPIAGGELIDHQGDCKERIAKRVQGSREAMARGEQSSILTGGDPSIFSAAWRIMKEFGDLGLNICPGISAFSAVAARAGAPLINDFVLLSGAKEPEKLARLTEAGFGAVVYNVGGQDLAPLLENVASKKPCVLAQDVSRDGEAFLTSTAGDLLEARPSGFRFTLIVACAGSYLKEGRIITKRGYQTKYSY
ncbi:MAG TPA: SAM-dependent methyltransferase [Methanotrichaceae archaeon]|nr:SAM-dependent methyltransferase [Methanotrichaceae archaeon]